MRKLIKDYNGRLSFLAPRWIWYGLRAVALEDGITLQELFTRLAARFLDERGIRPAPENSAPPEA